MRTVAVATAALLVLGAAVAVVANGNSAKGGRDVAVAASQKPPAPVVVTESSAQPTTTPAEEPQENVSPVVAAPEDPKPASPSPAKRPVSKAPAKPSAPAAQNIQIGFGADGYSPSTVTASAASPLKLSVDKGEGCAAGFLIPELNISADNSAGPITIDLGTVPAGSYQFSCGMEMVTGTLIVK